MVCGLELGQPLCCPDPSMALVLVIDGMVPISSFRQEFGPVINFAKSL